MTDVDIAIYAIRSIVFFVVLIVAIALIRDDDPDDW